MLKKYAMFDAAGVRYAHLIEGVNDIPESAVPISESLFMRMTQEGDGQWMIDANGAISKVAFAEPTQQTPTTEQLTEAERKWRDDVLSSVMWLRERHRDQLEIESPTTLTDEQFKELLVYMQALRDWPQSPDFPQIEHRPAAPPWIAEQTE